MARCHHRRARARRDRVRRRGVRPTLNGARRRSSRSRPPTSTTDGGIHRVSADGRAGDALRPEPASRERLVPSHRRRATPSGTIGRQCHAAPPGRSPGRRHGGPRDTVPPVGVEPRPATIHPAPGRRTAPTLRAPSNASSRGRSIGGIRVKTVGPGGTRVPWRRPADASPSRASYTGSEPFTVPALRALNVATPASTPAPTQPATSATHA